MRREDVDIYLFPNLAVVEATFELQNEGPATELDVGWVLHSRAVTSVLPDGPAICYPLTRRTTTISAPASDEDYG